MIKQYLAAGALVQRHWGHNSINSRMESDQTGDSCRHWLRPALLSVAVALALTTSSLAQAAGPTLQVSGAAVTSDAAAAMDSKEAAAAASDLEAMMVLQASTGDAVNEYVHRNEEGGIDPMTQDNPSLWQRLFGLGVSDALAGPVSDIAADNNAYIWPQLMESLDEVTLKQDGSAEVLKLSPFKITPKMLLRDDVQEQHVILEQLHRGISFVSYLLHMYTPHSSGFKVPLFFLNAKSLKDVPASIGIGIGGEVNIVGKQVKMDRPIYHLSLVRDLVYKDGECAGLGYIEADLKGKCRTPHDLNGLILLSMPIPEIAREGVYTEEPLLVTPNVLKSNYFAQGVGLGLQLAGIHSSYDPNDFTFKGALNSFDRHLFYLPEKRFVTAGQVLNEDSQNREKSPLYFVGTEVNKLLAPGNEDTPFNLNTIGSLDLGTPDAEVAPEVHDFKKAHENDEGEADLGEALASTDQETGEADQTLFKARMAEIDAAAIFGREKKQEYLSADTDQASKDEAQAAAAASAQDGADALAGNRDKEGRSPSSSGINVSDEELKGRADVAHMAAEHVAAVRAQAVDYTEPDVTDSVAATSDAPSALYGLPISFSALGRPLISLRNTLLSSDQYKNYSFLTEVEMAVLSDIGYRIESREFFGNSIYSFGTPDKQVTRTVMRNYSYYDHGSETYQSKRPAIAPLGIGVHVYGSYNDVIHGRNVSSVGKGAIGVRVDGSHNYYYQTPKSGIVTAGDNAIGIAFTYGCDNRAYISGYVSAPGTNGIGIKVDMGSNIYSDLIEYRGSYARVRTLDYLQGVSTRDEAASVPLLDDLKGPQVSSLVIDGVVEGTNAAIYIDESSFVKDISVTANAVVNGGIYSTWNPVSYGSGNILLKHDGKNSKLLDGIVQMDRTEEMKHMTTREIIDRYLTTNINLGVLLDEYNRPIKGESEESYAGNDKSRVVLSGDISGNAFNLRHFGGKSSILGNVRANQVSVYSGILSLLGDEGAINQIQNLDVRSMAVLDMVNGRSSHTYVQGNMNFGRNVVIRVDVDSKGNLLDDVSYNGELSALDYQLTIEPGVGYDELRRFGADPKALLAFISNFMQNCNNKFAKDGVTLRFPNYIWDNSSSYGREIKCGARGCRIGAFASNAVRQDLTQLPLWRYVLSGVGMLLLVLGFYGWYYLDWFKSRRK